MKSKDKKIAGLAFLLAALIITVGLISGCVRGAVAVGWSGGEVAGDKLFVGSKEGRLVAVNIDDDSILRADPLVGQTQGGLFSCASIGCGGGSTAVPIYGTPAVSGELVYIAGYNGKIYAYRTDNLAQRWVYPREGYLQQFVGGPVAYQDKIFIGCSDGKVYALDQETGDLLYEYQTGDKIWGTPAIDEGNNTLYIGSFDKKLYALNADDLTLKWSFTAEGSIIATPLVENDIVYIGAFDKYLYALNSSDGTEVWRFTGENWFWAPPVIVNGVLYAGCLDNFVYALNPITGIAVRDAYDLQGPVASAPVVVDNLVVFATQEGGVYKIDAGTQEMTPILDLEVNIDGPLAASGEIVYIHPGIGGLIRVNAMTNAMLPTIALQTQ